jgi:hypothetical protein
MKARNDGFDRPNRDPLSPAVDELSGGPRWADGALRARFVEAERSNLAAAGAGSRQRVAATAAGCHILVTSGMPRGGW